MECYNWYKLGEPQVTKTRENCENRKNFVRCCYWRWWCWFILNSSHVRFLSTTYTYHRTLNSLRTQFNTQDLTKRSPKKFSNKIMFFVVESPIELFMSTHWRTCLRYKVGIKWQNFVNTFYKNYFVFDGSHYTITSYCTIKLLQFKIKSKYH